MVHQKLRGPSLTEAELTTKLAAAEAEIKRLKAALTSAPAPADGDVSEVKTNEEPQ